MKKIILAAFSFLFALTPVLTVGLPTAAHAGGQPGLIRGTGPTVYWYSEGKRYAFPTLQTFYSWFTSDDFARVEFLTDQQLGAIQLGGECHVSPRCKAHQN